MLSQTHCKIDLKFTPFRPKILNLHSHNCLFYSCPQNWCL
jgi:hypothetical protein